MTKEDLKWWCWEILENPLAPKTHEILFLWQRKDPEKYQKSLDFTDWTSESSRILGRFIKREAADRLTAEMRNAREKLSRLTRLMATLEG